MVERWEVLLYKQAHQDAKKLKSANLKFKAAQLLTSLETDPFREQPRYKKLSGYLAGYYSRRINLQHRMVYEVNKKKRQVRVIQMFSHYGKK